MMALNHKPETVSREVIDSIRAPLPTATWNPIPHNAIIQTLEDRLVINNIGITNRRYVVSHEGNRMFATMEVQNCDAPQGCRPTIGVRNSTDQRFACGIAAGLLVVCCSNGSFTADEIALSRKHTLNILRDLPELVKRAVNRLQDMWRYQQKQVDAYRQTRLTDIRAHDLVIKAMDTGGFAASQIPAVLEAYRRPGYEEFSKRTVWSLFNAGTEVLKKANPFSLPARTQALHRVCDGFVGLN